MEADLLTQLFLSEQGTGLFVCDEPATFGPSSCLPDALLASLTPSQA